MIRLIQTFSVFILLGFLSAACSKDSGSKTPDSAATGDGSLPYEVEGKTPLTRRAWCTADIRGNTTHQSRIQFRDNLQFESSLYQMNDDKSRGAEVWRKDGTWAQKDAETVTVTFDGQSTDLKMNLVLKSADSGDDRLFLGPNKDKLPVFDPCP